MIDDDVIEDAGLARLEGMMLAAGDEQARVLRRIRQRGITPGQYAELVEWVAHLRISRGLSPNTGANYLEAVSAFAEWLNGRGQTLDRVAARDLDQWSQELYLAHGEAAHTRHVKLTGVRQFYHWRESDGRGPSPVRTVRSPRREERVPRKFSQAQLAALFATCDRETVMGRRDFAILSFLLATGARRMEVAGLRLGQLEIAERVGAVRFLGKGAQERMVSFDGHTVRALQAWLADRDNIAPLPDPSAVFVSLTNIHRGEPLQAGGLEGVIARAIRRAKLKLEPGMALHTIRATYATTMYDATGDIERVRLLLGHKDINTTRRYLAISGRQLRARMPSDFMGEVMGEGGGLPRYLQNKLKGGKG